MNNEDLEDVFEDIDDEVVSSDFGDIEPIIEEQPEKGVPSNSNGSKFIKGVKKASDYQKQQKSSQNNFKSNQAFEKNNKNAISKLDDIKSKGQGLNKGNIASQAGKQIGNKLAGKSEEEKGKLEKATDDIGGKATGAALTAATGGAINGAAADALGNAAYQLIKKKAIWKAKIIAACVVAGISLLIILILATNEDDELDGSIDTANKYAVSNMSDSDLDEYLKYIGVCDDDGEKDRTEEDEKSTNTADCRYAKQYFKKIKSNYENYNKECTSEITVSKDINNPCNVELNVSLLHETLSYGKSNDELWNKRTTTSQEKDIEDLSEAMVEYVEESCYVNIKIYTKNGVSYTYECDGCQYFETKKDPQTWFYFQLSFDKYVSFLKYGYSSAHPYYTEWHGLVEQFHIGAYSIFPLWRANNDKETRVLFGENHDHECVGPSNSKFDFSDVLSTATTSSDAYVVCEKWSGNQSLCDTTKCNWNNSTKACTKK